MDKNKEIIITAQLFQVDWKKKTKRLTTAAYSQTCANKGPVIIYQLGGGAILGGGSWKKSTPNGGVKISFNFIYESMAGGGREGSQIWFPFPFLASKCSGEAPQTPSPIINFLTFHAPLFTTTTTWKWRDMHMLRCPQSDSFVAVHTVTWSYASTDKCI